MSDKKETKKFKVVKSSVGTLIIFKGEQVILNNGLTQKLLKELFNTGMKAIINE